MAVKLAEMDAAAELEILGVAYMIEPEEKSIDDGFCEIFTRQVVEEETN